MKKLIAYTRDGMHFHYRKEVKEISVWINNECDHPVCEESIAALLEEAGKSGRMQIYISENDKIDGSIDAFDCTPLYTNGQVSVCILELGSEIIWTSSDYYTKRIAEIKAKAINI